MKSRQTQPWHLTRPKLCFPFKYIPTLKAGCLSKTELEPARMFCHPDDVMSGLLPSFHHEMEHWTLWCDEAYFSRTAWIIITQYANVCWLITVWKSPLTDWVWDVFCRIINLSFTWWSVFRHYIVFFSLPVSVHAEGARTLALSTLGLVQVGVQSPGQDSHSVITHCR